MFAVGNVSVLEVQTGLLFLVQEKSFRVAGGGFETMKSSYKVSVNLRNRKFQWRGKYFFQSGRRGVAMHHGNVFWTRTSNLLLKF